MAETENRIVLPDGRSLGYARFGDSKGKPCVYMHGFPASRLEAGFLDAAARHLGVSVIAPDRPGIGLSDFQAGRTIRDWPNDVLALTDALGLARFAVIGDSGGCPFALACAYALPERVTCVGIVAGLGPTEEPEVAGPMGAPARLGFMLARRAPLLFKLIYGALAIVVARRPGLVFRLNNLVGRDQEVLARPEIRAVLTHSMRASLQSGGKGAIHDFSLLAHPWGFPLEAVSVPVQLWHGRADTTVPQSSGEYLARLIPAAQLWLLPDEGHFSLMVDHPEEILERLIPSPSLPCWLRERQS